MNAVGVSIVIPVHNEAVTLPALTAELVRLTPSVDALREILIVDDASTDASVDGVPGMFPVVRVLRFASRRGSGSARKVGAEVARGALVAWIDGDGTYAAADLWRLVAEIGDADEIIGARAADFGRWRLLRLATKRVTCLIASALWRVPIPDLNSGLRVFRASALAEILPELPAGFSCTSTATLAALNRGHRVRFVPISYHPRIRGHTSKFHPVWDTFRLWRVVARQWHRRRMFLPASRATAAVHADSPRPLS